MSLMPAYCKICNQQKTFEEITMENHVCKSKCSKCNDEGWIENYNNDIVNCPTCRGIK